LSFLFKQISVSKNSQVSDNRLHRRGLTGSQLRSQTCHVQVHHFLLAFEDRLRRSIAIGIPTSTESLICPATGAVPNSILIVLSTNCTLARYGNRIHRLREQQSGLFGAREVSTLGRCSAPAKRQKSHLSLDLLPFIRLWTFRRW